MVDGSQRAERQVVVLDVVGSSPTVHPIISPSSHKASKDTAKLSMARSKKTCRSTKKDIHYLCI